MQTKSTREQEQGDQVSGSGVCKRRHGAPTRQTNPTRRLAIGGLLALGLALGSFGVHGLPGTEAPRQTWAAEGATVPALFY